MDKVMLNRLPLSAIYTFIVVAESRNFTEAAQKLFVTQGAISKQIKQLENNLEAILFKRQVHQITLTRQGMILYHHAKPALEEISKGIWQVQTHQRYTLIIQAAPTFATRWLAAHLHDFYYQYPHVEITLVDTHAEFKQPAHCMISFSENSSHPQAICLMREHNIAVCAAHLFEAEPTKLFAKYPLLHILNGQQRLSLWQDWTRQTQLPIEVTKGLSFSTQDQVINAVLNGLGIAIVDQNMVFTLLKHRLIFPVTKDVLNSRYGYWLENNAPHNIAVTWFCTWIQRYILNLASLTV